MRVWFLGALVLLAAACPSPSNKAPEAPTVDSVSVESLSYVPAVVDSNVTLDSYWKPNDDGRGPLSGFMVYARDFSGLHADTLFLPSTARSARIVLGPYPSGTFEGEACVVAQRRKENSTPSCKPWSKTFAPPVVPPPPLPVLSALTPTAIEDTVRLAFSVDDVADASGVSNALIIRAGDNQGIDSDSIQIPITSTSASIKLAKYGYGTTPTGYGCVYQLRNGVVSEGRCQSWTITIPDIPPPEPIFDSLILRLEEVAYINRSTTGALHLDESITLGEASTLDGGTGIRHGVCVFAHLKNGKVGLKPSSYYYRTLQGESTTAEQWKGCDNLYSTRYTSTQRALTSAELVYVRNRVKCLRWTVVGGGITTTRPKFRVEGCDTITVTPTTGPVLIDAELM